MKLAAVCAIFLLPAATVSFSREFGELSDAERKQLHRDKVLIGATEFRQCFEPYINNAHLKKPLPAFITSDALLNAFHVIFEESFARLEAGNLARLESLLGRINKSLPQAVKDLKGAEKLKAPAAQRAEIMVKIALRLLGRPAAGSNKTIEQVIAAQVNEVEADPGDPDWENLQAEYQKAMTAHDARVRDVLDELLKKIEHADPVARTELLAGLHLKDSINLLQRWQGLAKLCSRAQSIAQHQLRKIALTKEENEFIRGFGQLLAAAMYYDRNSYLRPNDDAPRVADVFSGRVGHLHVGIGRPRILYVMYPWNGAEVLCIGSVLPYYEFKHGPARLTDQAWQAMLNANAPPRPAWVQPVFLDQSAPGK